MSGLLGLVGGDVLFAEDFDRPETEQPQPEPEVVESVFDQTELEAAKSAAFEEGVAAGRAALIAEDAAALRQAVGALADELRAARDGAVAIGEQAAREIARLLLASLGAVMPILRESLGAAEACAVARAVLPGLTAEPEITLRANPHTAPALLAEIERMDPDLVSRVQIVTTDALPRGDLRISWRNGLAVREGAALWREVAAILVPQGLLATDQAIDESERKDA